MDEPILAIPIPAFTLAERTTSQIVPELIATEDGSQMTVRVGEHGERVVIPGHEVLRELIGALVAIGQRKHEYDQGISS